MKHIPVLLNEIIYELDIKSGDIILDGTLGGGGHTFEMIKEFGKDIKIIGLDLDSDAIVRVKELIDKTESDVVLKVAGFQDIDKVLSDLNLIHVDKILLDLGISSFQLEDSGRGFSFLKNEPLLMTMEKRPGKNDLTAKYIVNKWDEKSIADIIFGFGEEKHSRRIAKAIVENRNEKEIKTTFDLVNIIEESVGGYYKKTKIHPATRTFQALRIATNSELTNLQKVIEKGFDCLSINGRMAIISFHSLEDRIVKRAFVDLKQKGYANIITKKPIISKKDELVNNPRARSAKLRLIEKI